MALLGRNRRLDLVDLRGVLTGSEVAELATPAKKIEKNQALKASNLVAQSVKLKLITSTSALTVVVVVFHLRMCQR